MFDNVLVGVDGRSGGRDAVALAAQLLAGEGRLTLAHVRQGELNPLHAVTPKLLREEHAGSEELLERERSNGRVDAELTSIVALSPGRALHEQAERQHADLVVVGSCSRGTIGRVMLGDDTRAALNGAPCAVAIAAGGLAANPQIATIGVAYNGSPESEAALAAARALAGRHNASVRALEVVTMPTYGVGLFAMPIAETIDDEVQSARLRLGELRGVKAQAIYGIVPGEELAAFGNELDILIVGSRSYGPLKRLVLGSTSSYLERHAHCSLLVLPRPAPRELAGEDERSGARLTST